MDVFDSLLNKRLEERIHQLQVFRQQLELIQMRNEREIMAAKIKNDKIVDKMKRLSLDFVFERNSTIDLVRCRTKQRLEAVTDELRRERLGIVETTRPVRAFFCFEIV